MTLTYAQNIKNSVENDSNARSRIADARAQHKQSNAQARAACYQNFAVNDCLERERAQHAQRMDDLRRQEIGLNDAQRKQRGAKQVQQIDDKVSAEKQAQAAKNRAQALQRSQERQDAAEQKRLDKERKAQDLLQNPAAAKQAKTPPAAANKPSSHAKLSPSHAEQAAKAVAKRQAYDARQVDAARRRAQLEKKRAEQKKAPAASLPVSEQTPASPKTQ